ncbi:hypothetical protein CFB39_19430 [Burkholderia sp. AU6039]|nr:hypothetical protein CFB39_19430 [Burkholderia sp. AU6039]
MISLPPLKGQMQHITDERRAYCCDGFCREFEMKDCRKQFARLDCLSSLGSSLLSVPGKRSCQHTRPAAVARSA